MSTWGKTASKVRVGCGASLSLGKIDQRMHVWLRAFFLICAWENTPRCKYYV